MFAVKNVARTHRPPLPRVALARRIEAMAVAMVLDLREYTGGGNRL
jgi:hypothetical protein